MCMCHSPSPSLAVEMACHLGNKAEVGKAGLALVQTPEPTEAEKENVLEGGAGQAQPLAMLTLSPRQPPPPTPHQPLPFLFKLRVAGSWGTGLTG